MDRSQIEQIRRFNRLVTLRAGALDGHYLGRNRSLGQARLLFEIGPDGADIRDLRERLGLDSGYASRLLRALAAQGLIVVESDAADRRRRRAKLTEKGEAERAAYDATSDELARSLLSRLKDGERERLAKAMAEVERLLTAATLTISEESADDADVRHCVEAYYRELDQRFDGGFDPTGGGYAGTASAYDEQIVYLVARMDGRTMGCGMLKALDAETGEIKRMWVAPEARGLGLSRRLLEALETKARGLGMRRIRLDTNRTLTEAQALYDKTGYRRIAPYNDNSYADFWFEKDL